MAPLFTSTVQLLSWVYRDVYGTKKIKNKLETKASSPAGQCIPAGSSVSLPRMVLITIYVNNNHA